VINLNTTLKDIKGKDIVDADGDCMTIRSICAQALTMASEHNNKISGKDKVKQYNLAMKMMDESIDEIQLKAKEIVILNNVIGATYAPLVAGQIYNLLEPNAEED
jgi:hypothetical protein